MVRTERLCIGSRLLGGLILFVVVVLWGSASVAWTQQATGDILGTVTDTTGAPLPNASVTIINLGTRLQRTTATSDTGDYDVPVLQPGQYSVKINAKGFKSYSVPELTLAAGDRARFNASLAVGAMEETVTVEADATALQTDSSVLQNTVVQAAVASLPLNGRNVVTMIQVQPGVNEGQPFSLTAGNQLDDSRETADFAANGQSDAFNNEMIDGLDNNERWIGTIGTRPSVEDIAEINVQTSDYTAEVGRTGGGVIDIITKSGTNSFHGSLFEYVRNDKFDAANYDFGQDLPKGEFRQNQFGGSLGGPIKKNKTFFFGDYEGFRRVQQAPPIEQQVPTKYEVDNPGDFTDIGGPNLTLTPNLEDPAGLAYFELWPEPTTTLNGIPFWVGSAKNTQNAFTIDARVDHSFNANNILWTHYDLNDYRTTTPGALPPKKLLGTSLIENFNELGGYAPQFDWNAGAGYVHTFTPHFLMEIKAGYMRDDNEWLSSAAGTNPNQALGQPGVNTQTDGCTGLAPVIVGGLGYSLEGFGCVFSPDLNLDNVYQLMGDIQVSHGTHNFKFGAGGIKRQLRQVQTPWGEGEWINLPPIWNLVEGNMASVTRTLMLVVPHYQSYESDFYGMDDWHLAKDLTLNISLRWDYYQPLTESHNHISNWDPSTETLLVASQDGVSKYAGVIPRHTDFEPRVGFAYTVRPGFVVRGGYGISFWPENSASNGSLKNPPFVSSTVYNNLQFINGLPEPQPSSLSEPGVTIPYSEDIHFHDTYVQQFNLTAQKDFSGNVVTFTYVGLLGRHLAELIPDVNAAPPNTLGWPAANTLRPTYSKYPNLGLIGANPTEGASSYNGFQASFERRLKRGLTLNANYTQSRGLDDSDDFTSGNAENGGFTSLPNMVSKIEYSNSVLDIRSHIAMTFNYELPFAKGASSRAAKFLAQGWRANTIFAWSTGIPFTVLNGTDVSGTVNGGPDGYGDRPNRVAPNLYPSKKTLTEFFNTGAFAAQKLGTYGVLADDTSGATIGPNAERRTDLYGPHFRHLDFSVFKIFPVTERSKLEFRVETFNLTNTANFNIPGTTLGAGSYGAITSMQTFYNPREIQLALRLSF